MRQAKSQRSRIARPSAQKPFQILRMPGEDAAAIAEYISDITAELARLAGSVRLDTLTYFLNMARMEAESHVSRAP